VPCSWPSATRTSCADIHQSDLEWTIVRPRRLDNRPPRGYQAATERRPAFRHTTSRADVAAFISQEVRTCRYLRHPLRDVSEPAGVPVVSALTDHCALVVVVLIDVGGILLAVVPQAAGASRRIRCSSRRAPWSLSRARSARAWLKPTYVTLLVLAAALLAPLAMPILPPATFVRTYGFLTGVGNGGAGQHTAGAFPQYLGDRFGWDTLTQTVQRVYAGLPPAERARACVLTGNYGEASALSLLGAPGRLPPVISGHNNYYLWGPGPCTGQVLIVLGYAPGDLAQGYARVVLATTNVCRYCMEEENNLPIYLCTHPRGVPFKDLWRRIKHFD
jgi:hypothetical protein